MTRKTAVMAGVSVAFVVLVLVVVHLLVSRGDAFHAARSALAKDSVFVAEQGSLESARLVPFGYSISVHGPDGRASMEIEFVSGRGKGRAFVELTKELGEWRVTRTRIVNANR